MSDRSATRLSGAYTIWWDSWASFHATKGMPRLPTRSGTRGWLGRGSPVNDQPPTTLCVKKLDVYVRFSRNRQFCSKQVVRPSTVRCITRCGRSDMTVEKGADTPTAGQEVR